MSCLRRPSKSYGHKVSDFYFPKPNRFIGRIRYRNSRPNNYDGSCTIVILTLPPLTELIFNRFRRHTTKVHRLSKLLLDRLLPSLVRWGVLPPRPWFSPLLFSHIGRCPNRCAYLAPLPNLVTGDTVRRFLADSPNRVFSRRLYRFSFIT